MPEIWAGALGEERVLTTADGGTALTSSATYTQFPAINEVGGTRQGYLTYVVRNFSGANVVQVQLNPWLTVLKTTNNMETKPADYSLEAQDASTTTYVVLDSLDTVANGDWVLVGSHVPFSGMYATVSSANGTGSVTVTISYPAPAWTDISDTDGTSTTTHLDTTGAITWTVPSAWKRLALSQIYPNLKWDAYYRDVPMYWVRWEVDLAVDSDTKLSSLTSINRSTAVAEYLSGMGREARIKYGFGGHGNIAALTDAGTANLVANLAIEGVF